MSVEQSVECLVRETEVLGENLPQCCFVRHKSHMALPRPEPELLWREASDPPPDLWHSPLGNISNVLEVMSLRKGIWRQTHADWNVRTV
jgi:hypothetical protein